ncbi:MAG: activator of HSP90 ATPase [Bacteroidetes bacterium]|nr:activator of HSP90 ATPase [Bacteroidota bacterium]
MSKQKITIQATITADKKLVWESYTNPKYIIHWNFASDDWHCPSASNDLRVGGTYKARMEAKDGSFGFDFEAIYTKVSEGESFTYVLSDEREINVRFTELENKTEVVIIFDAETENSIELQKNGWQAILNNFKLYTESL